MEKLDRRIIAEIMPHKGIMLLLDGAVIGDEGDKRKAAGVKDIKADDPFMKDHPWAYPGVLLEECVNQLAYLLVVVSFVVSEKPLLIGNDGKKIGKPALPGDRLYISVELLKHRSNFFFFDGRIINQNNELVLEVKNIKGAAMLL